MKKLIAVALIASASAQEAVVWPYTLPPTGNSYQAAMLAQMQEQVEIQRKMAMDLEYQRWRMHMEELTRPTTHHYFNTQP